MQSNRFVVSSVLCGSLVLVAGCANWSPPHSNPRIASANTMDQGAGGRPTAPLTSYQARPVVELTGRMWPVIPSAYVTQTALVRPGVHAADFALNSPRSPVLSRNERTETGDLPNRTGKDRLSAHTQDSSVSGLPSAAVGSSAGSSDTTLEAERDPALSSRPQERAVPERDTTAMAPSAEAVPDNTVTAPTASRWESDGADASLRAPPWDEAEPVNEPSDTTSAPQ